MTPQEKEYMNALCRKIQVETDSQKFNRLVLELSVLLEKRSNQLQEKPSPKTLPQ